MTSNGTASFSIRKLEPRASSGTVSMPFDAGTLLPEYHAILSVLSRAFAGDLFTAVVNGWDVEDPDRSYYEAFLMAPIISEALSAGGEIYVVETNTEEEEEEEEEEKKKKIVGVAGWFGPGYSLFESEEEQQYALVPFMETLSPELQSWWQTAFLPTWEGFTESAFGAGVQHRSWSLQTLAVDPDYQGRGIATMLIDAVVRKSEGRMLCVETTTLGNVGYSRRQR
ncbi:hypothetical protein C8F01DRAFT_34998 [Mycena amicta]|nr:hypothetical protein C8F01DRAFT_34998 [Mycena amicta]